MGKQCTFMVTDYGEDYSRSGPFQAFKCHQLSYKEKMQKAISFVVSVCYISCYDLNWF